MSTGTRFSLFRSVEVPGSLRSQRLELGKAHELWLVRGWRFFWLWPRTWFPRQETLESQNLCFKGLRLVTKEVGTERRNMSPDDDAN